MEYNNTVDSLKEMVRSCFAYGGGDRDSWNFKRYIKPYEDKLGIDKFNEIYESYLKELKDNYDIKTNVYTDSDGCTYNELVKK